MYLFEWAWLFLKEYAWNLSGTKCLWSCSEFLQICFAFMHEDEVLLCYQISWGGSLSLLNKWVTSGVSHLKIQLKVEYIPCRRHKNASSSFSLFLNKDCWKWSHQELRFERLKHNYFWNSQIKGRGFALTSKAACILFNFLNRPRNSCWEKTYAAVCSSHLLNAKQYKGYCMNSP